MANPFSGIITSQLKKVFSNAVKALLASDGITVPCRLIYPGVITLCPNCEINPVNNKSKGIYKSGGPVPFNNGVCPHCAGEGKKETPSVEVIYLCLSWDYKDWKKLGFNLETPEGHCLSLCNIDLMPKIKRAKEIILNTNDEEYVKRRFTRVGEPNPCGCCVGDTTFIATLWKVAG